MVIFKTKEGIVPANENNIIFTDVTINEDSIIEVYFTNPSVFVTAISQESDKVFVTCSPHLEAVGVKLFINNVEEFSPYDDSDIEQHLGLVDQTLTAIGNELDERVPEDTVLGGVLYHSNTGNIWKKLNATNINYDDDSTLYSAMGDIDSLETDSKNLVGAINELKESGGGGSVPFSAGNLTAVTNIRTLGASRWYKIGRLCFVSFEDLQFLNNGTYTGHESSPIYMKGLPKPVRGYNGFVVRHGDDRTSYNCCRFVVAISGNEGVIKPHYTSVVGNTNNFYGMTVYECVE